MKKGNDGSQKRKSPLTKTGAALERLRKAHYHCILDNGEKVKLTQEKLCEILNLPGKREYSNYLTGKVLLDSEYLERLATFYGVSVDCVLGRTTYTSVSNELVGKEYGLSDNALNGIRKINNDSIEKIKRHGEAYQKGINLAQPQTKMDLLNFLLSSETFHSFLHFYLDYIHTAFGVPVFLDEEKGEMVAPKNAFSFIDGQWILNVASSPDNPGDCRPILLSPSFFEQVAKNRMDECIKSLKQEYVDFHKLYIQMVMEEYEKAKKKKSRKK